MTEHQPQSNESPEQPRKLFSRDTATAFADAAKLRAKQAALLAHLKKLETIDQPGLLRKIGQIVRGSSLDVPQKAELDSEIARLEEKVAKIKDTTGLERVKAQVDAGLVSGQIAYAYQRLGESAVATLQAGENNSDLSVALLEFRGLKSKIESVRRQIQGMSEAAANDPRLREAAQTAASNTKTAYQSASQELSSNPASKKSNWLVWILTVLLPPVGLWFTWRKASTFSLKRKLGGTFIGVAILSLLVLPMSKAPADGELVLSSIAASSQSGLDEGENEHGTFFNTDTDVHSSLDAANKALQNEMIEESKKRPVIGGTYESEYGFNYAMGAIIRLDTGIEGALETAEAIERDPDGFIRQQESVYQSATGRRIDRDATLSGMLQGLWGSKPKFPPALMLYDRLLKDFAKEYAASLPKYKNRHDKGLKITKAEVGKSHIFWNESGTQYGGATFVVDFETKSNGLSGTKVILAYFERKDGSWTRGDHVKIYDGTSAVERKGRDADILPLKILD